MGRGLARPQAQTHQRSTRYRIHAGRRHVLERHGPLRYFGHALHGRSALDNSVALRPGNNWPPRATEADWNLDYVGGDALLPSHDQSASITPAARWQESHE